MKNRYNSFFITIRNVLLIFIFLEFILGFFFNFNDKRRYDQNTQIKMTSGAYEHVAPTIVKEMYDELFIQDTQWEPFVHYKLKEFKGKYNNIDANGIRKTANLNIKDMSPKFKIFCFGGSTMFSTGARDKHTIPSQLSKLIYHAFPNHNIEIINFGCHGYNRSIENIQLQQQLLKNNIPDLVIFYDGVNEIIAAHQNNEAGMPTNAQNRKKESKLGHSYNKKLQLLLTSSYTNRFISYLQRRLFNTKLPENQSPKKLSKDIARNYIQNIKISKSLETQFHFKTFNFLQPVIYSKKRLTESEKIAAKENNYYKALYRLSYDIIKKDTLLIQDNTFTDITDVFNYTNKVIYTDFCHTAEYGNKLVAAKLFKKIKPLLLQKELIHNTTALD